MTDVNSNLACVPSPSRQQADRTEATTRNRRALDRLRRGDLEGALDELDQALALQADHAEAWNNRGMILHMLGRLEEALVHFDRAVAERANYSQALNNRARVRQALGDLSGARADFDDAVACAADREMASVLHNRGVLRQTQGDLAGALADFDQALALAPQHQVTYGLRGVVRKEAGDLAGARADLDRALDDTPSTGSAALFHARGGVRALQNDFVGAIADYTCALDQEPLNYLFFLSRGNAYYHRRDGRAVLDYRTAFRLDPEGAAREALRLLTADIQEKGEDVLDNCTRHLRLNKLDILARLRRGLTLLLLGRDFEAAGDLDEVRKTYPPAAPHLNEVIQMIHAQRSQLGVEQVSSSSTEEERRIDMVFAHWGTWN